MASVRWSLVAMALIALPFASRASERSVERARTHLARGEISKAWAQLSNCKSAPCAALRKELSEFGELHERVEDLDARGLTRLLNLRQSGGKGPAQGNG